MKEWIKTEAVKIKEKVRVFAVHYHLSYSSFEDFTPTGNGPEFIYCTEQNFFEEAEKWNMACWGGFDTEAFNKEMFREWITAKRFDLKEDDEEVTERIFDLAVIAVSELHSEEFFEKTFGRKIPVIMTDTEYYYKTAVLAAKANGREMFDEEFFSEMCGIDRW